MHSRGDTPEGTVDEAHIASGAANVDGGNTESAASGCRQRFGDREDHTTGAARGFANGDRIGGVVVVGADSHLGHQLRDMLRGVEFAAAVAGAIRLRDFHVRGTEEIGVRLVFHFEDERSECRRKTVEVRTGPVFRFFEIFGFTGLDGERASGERNESVEDLGAIAIRSDLHKLRDEGGLFHRLRNAVVTPPTDTVGYRGRAR